MNGVTAEKAETKKQKHIEEREFEKSLVKEISLQESNKPILQPEDFQTICLRPSIFERGNPQVGRGGGFFISANQIFPATNKTLRRCQIAAKTYLQRYEGIAETSQEGQRISIDPIFTSEFAGSRYSQYVSGEKTIGKDRMRLMSAILPLIRYAYNPRHEDPKHEHGGKRRRYFAHGVTRYDSDVDIEQPDGSLHSYTVTLVVANHENGKKYLYDVINLRPQGTPEVVRQSAADEISTQKALDEWLRTF